MSDRLAGIVLFLPVPAVLLLFTRSPLGVVPSLALGLALVATHRLYARPWALARADRRCLWCGGAAGPGAAAPRIPLREPGGASRWRACSAEHADALARFLGWAARRARFLRAGILGTLLLFLVAQPLAAWGRLGPATPAHVADAFRVGIAIAVLPLGWLSARSRPAADAPTVPFPVHIQALVGGRAVRFLFRWVGLAWLALGAWGLVRP